MRSRMREGVEVFNIFQQNGIILNGHFEFVTGMHGDKYVNHRAIFQNPRISRQLSLMLAERFRQDALNDAFSFVIGPATFGAQLADQEARHLTYFCGRIIMPLVAHKRCENCQERGFYLDEDTIEQIKGKRGLLVDDVGNAGFSGNAVTRAVHDAGGEIVSIGYICNRGRLTKESFPGIEHFETLLDFPLESWDPKNGGCKLCVSGVPLNMRYGHGRRNSNHTIANNSL